MVFHVGHAVHQAASAARSLEFQPLLTIGGTLHTMMDMPFTEFKIEIVQSRHIGHRRLGGFGDILGVRKGEGAHCRCQYAGRERDAEISHRAILPCWFKLFARSRWPYRNVDFSTIR